MSSSITSRRQFLNVIGALSAFSLLACSSRSQKEALPPKTNIIYILADDLGYGDLGCYGQDKIQTPNIDQMAAEGMLFTDHYAGSTVCAPSRCSLMTGLHQGNAVIRGNMPVEPMGQMPLPAGTPTVANYMQRAGYKTGLIGKWGLGGPDSVGEPTCQGFNYFFGYLCQRHAHNYYPEFLYRNRQRVALEGNVVNNERSDGAGVAEQKAHYSHDLFVDDALNFIASQQQPFFLYLALTIPHANNEAGDAGMEVPNSGAYSHENWPAPEIGKAAMITRMDRDVGRLLQKLQDLGIAENTLVIFTSDNGPHQEGGVDPSFFKSSGALRGIKRDLYEGGIRVPMIAWWPGTIKPKSVSNHVSAFWDFLPTACDVAGIPVPPQTDGISFLPTLKGAKQSTHDYLYWEFVHGEHFKQAVRIERWKAVRNGLDAPIELYNVQRDIGESRDVSGEWPELVQTVTNIFDKAHTRSAVKKWNKSLQTEANKGEQR